MLRNKISVLCKSLNIFFDDNLDLVLFALKAALSSDVHYIGTLSNPGGSACVYGADESHSILFQCMFPSELDADEMVSVFLPLVQGGK